MKEWVCATSISPSYEITTSAFSKPYMQREENPLDIGAPPVLPSRSILSLID